MQITIGALEPQFYALLLSKLGLADVDPAAQYDRATWPQLRGRLAALFNGRPRGHWCAVLEGTDACFAPDLSLDEAAIHPHNVARSIYKVQADGGHRGRTCTAVPSAYAARLDSGCRLTVNATSFLNAKPSEALSAGVS